MDETEVEKTKTEETKKTPRKRTPGIKAAIKDQPLYRLASNLAKGEKIIPRGSLDPLLWCTPDAIETLVDKSIISVVSSPPLEQLPGWELRAKRLGAFGIMTVIDLYNVMNDKLIAEALKITADTFRAWQGEAMSWIREPLSEG